MLYPLVEPALPKDMLRAWEQQQSSNRFSYATLSTDIITSLDSKSSNYFQKLLHILKARVESEERLALACFSFIITSRRDSNRINNTIQRNTRSTVDVYEHWLPTAATILTA